MKITMNEYLYEGVNIDKKFEKELKSFFNEDYNDFISTLKEFDKQVHSGKIKIDSEDIDVVHSFMPIKDMKSFKGFFKNYIDLAKSNTLAKKLDTLYKKQK